MSLIEKQWKKLDYIKSLTYLSKTNILFRAGKIILAFVQRCRNCLRTFYKTTLKYRQRLRQADEFYPARILFSFTFRHDDAMSAV